MTGEDPLSDDPVPGEAAGSLLAAIQQWAQRTLPAPPSGHEGPECQWCPLCQLASVLRGEHPELTDRVAEAGAAVAGAVRALAESATRGESASSDASATRAESASSDGAAPSDPPATRAAPPSAAPATRPRVQRIRLDDEPGAS